MQTSIPGSTTLCGGQVIEGATPEALPHRADTGLQRAEAVLELVCGPARSGCTAHGHPVSSCLITSSAATLTSVLGDLLSCQDNVPDGRAHGFSGYLLSWRISLLP